MRGLRCIPDTRPTAVRSAVPTTLAAAAILLTGTVGHALPTLAAHLVALHVAAGDLLVLLVLDALLLALAAGDTLLALLPLLQPAALLLPALALHAALTALLALVLLVLVTHAALLAQIAGRPAPPRLRPGRPRHAALNNATVRTGRCMLPPPQRTARHGAAEPHEPSGAGR